MSSTDARLWCLVPAAGRGARFGGELPKQYVELCGKPLLLRTLEALAAHPRIAGLAVALAEDDRHWPGLRELGGKPLLTAVGGETRSLSVLHGLFALHAHVDRDEYLLVHDAARPCVGRDDVSRLIELASAAGGGLLATPLRDTLKRADGECRVAATEPRDSRWRALTPQLFRRGELIAALEAAHATGVEVTDEAMAMEHAGHRPLLVEGAESNIKVTTREDLEIAAWLWSRRGRGRSEEHP
jgi:2-C-methyl-D-erythritol 4-phosphate cytidylyltransferase